MTSNRLKLNPDKTQFSWLGTWQQLCKFKSEPFVMPSGLLIEPMVKVRDLGVVLDSRLTMEDHVNEVVKSCMYQLRQLRTVRSSLTTEAAATLVHSFISCRLDYCNSILFGVSDRVLRKLQLVQNSAARLITSRRRFDHITSVLRDQLHWLPVRQRIVYKLALLVYGCLHGSSPQYLCDLLTPNTTLAAYQRLRSTAHGDLHLPESWCSVLASRSFRHSGAEIWNSLPYNIRDPSLSVNCFKKLLKTHLFNVAYSI
jgi:hypothetical protein